MVSSVPEGASFTAATATLLVAATLLSVPSLSTKLIVRVLVLGESELFA